MRVGCSHIVKEKMYLFAKFYYWSLCRSLDLLICLGRVGIFCSFRTLHSLVLINCFLLFLCVAICSWSSSITSSVYWTPKSFEILVFVLKKTPVKSQYWRTGMINTIEECDTITMCGVFLETNYPQNFVKPCAYWSPVERRSPFLYWCFH